MKGKITVRSLSKFGMIRLLIEKIYIPLSKTQMYAVLNAYENDKTAVPLWWTTHSKRGPRPHLLPKTLSDLTQSFHDSTDGGAAISKKELKETLSKHIINDRQSQTKKHMTMTLYLSRH